MTATECIPIYDFETALEAAVKAILVSEEIAAYTAYDAPELDLPRPRVEIQFQTGPATGHRTTTTDVYRPDSFTGNCSLTIITNTNDAEQDTDTPSNSGARAHAQYRALVRYLAAGIETALTNDDAGADTLLPYHSVNRFVENGTAPTTHHESGVLVSQLNFEVHFNIRPAAWPA